MDRCKFDSMMADIGYVPRKYEFEQLILDTAQYGVGWDDLTRWWEESKIGNESRKG